MFAFQVVEPQYRLVSDLVNVEKMHQYLARMITTILSTSTHPLFPKCGLSARVQGYLVTCWLCHCIVSV